MFSMRVILIFANMAQNGTLTYLFNMYRQNNLTVPLDTVYKL